MLMVDNVRVNHVRTNSLDFPDVRSIEDMVYQRPGGFETTLKGYFYQRARPQDIRLAERVIQGERFHLATRSLWFLDQVVIVLPCGMDNGIVDDLNLTVFSTHLN
jgi:N-acetylmuramoyl-L-alanine amidase